MFKSEVEKAKERKFKEKLYNEVAQELHQGKRHDAVWIKALADAAGNDGVAQGLYIKYRVQSIMDDIIISQEHENNICQIENERVTKIARKKSIDKFFNIYKKILLATIVIVTIIIVAEKW